MKVRIKEAATTRVVVPPFDADLDFSDGVIAATFLNREVQARRLRHPQGFRLQVLKPGKGWVDVGGPTGGA